MLSWMQPSDAIASKANWLLWTVLDFQEVEKTVAQFPELTLASVQCLKEWDPEELDFSLVRPQALYRTRALQSHSESQTRGHRVTQSHRPGATESQRQQSEWQG